MRRQSSLKLIFKKGRSLISNRWNFVKPSPSSTLLCRQSHPSGGWSFLVWLWDRRHPADGTHEICHSSLGFRHTVPLRPVATLFFGTAGRARRRWCWHMCQAPLPWIQKDKMNLKIYINSLSFNSLSPCVRNLLLCEAPMCWYTSQARQMMLLVKWKTVTQGRDLCAQRLELARSEECKHIPLWLRQTCGPLWLPGSWQHRWHFSFMDSPGQSHCCRPCFTHTDSEHTCRRGGDKLLQIYLWMCSHF